MLEIFSIILAQEMLIDTPRKRVAFAARDKRQLISMSVFCESSKSQEIFDPQEVENTLKLGIDYYQGNNVAKNIKTARSYLRKISHHTTAKVYLAKIYSTGGDGVYSNNQRAFDYAFSAMYRGGISSEDNASMSEIVKKFLIKTKIKENVNIDMLNKQYSEITASLKQLKEVFYKQSSLYNNNSLELNNLIPKISNIYSNLYWSIDELEKLLTKTFEPGFLTNSFALSTYSNLFETTNRFGKSFLTIGKENKENFKKLNKILSLHHSIATVSQSDMIPVMHAIFIKDTTSTETINNSLNVLKELNSKINDSFFANRYEQYAQQFLLTIFNSLKQEYALQIENINSKILRNQNKLLAKNINSFEAQKNLFMNLFSKNLKNIEPIENFNKVLEKTEKYLKDSAPVRNQILLNKYQFLKDIYFADQLKRSSSLGEIVSLDEIVSSDQLSNLPKEPSSQDISLGA